jgi:hypothetical protein
LIHEDALMSYYLDYYTSQYTEGNFAQFVYNSRWNAELNELIEEGCNYWEPQSIWSYSNNNAKVKLMSSVKINSSNRNSRRRKSIRDLMNSDTFEIEENLVQLNAAFLKSTLTWKYFRSMICLPHWKNLWGEIKRHR